MGGYTIITRNVSNEGNLHYFLIASVIFNNQLLKFRREEAGKEEAYFAALQAVLDNKVGWIG